MSKLMNLTFTHFNKEDIGKLYEAFVKAFAEYYVNFNPSADQFKNRIFNKLHIEPDLSGVIWEDQRMIGFILHTVNQYKGLYTAYNGGTGIIPERRNKKLMQTLYERLLPELADRGVDRILLEVVSENNAAIRFYQTLGFRYVRAFNCFKTYELYEPTHIFRIENAPEIKAEYQSFCEFEPSFLDSTDQLQFNMQKEFILEAYILDQLVGYIIFQPLLGRISQLAVSREHRGKHVAAELLAHAQLKSLNKKLTIMNIPEDETETISGLTSLGFKNEVTQFEMELVI